MGVLFLFNGVRHRNSAVAQGTGLEITTRVRMVPNDRIIGIALSHAQGLYRVVLNSTGPSAILNGVSKNQHVENKVTLTRRAYDGTTGKLGLSQRGAINDTLKRLRARPKTSPSGILNVQNGTRTVSRQGLTLIISGRRTQHVRSTQDLDMRNHDSLKQETRVRVTTARLLGNGLAHDAGSIIETADTCVTTIFVFGHLEPTQLINSLARAVNNGTRLGHKARVSTQYGGTYLVHILLSERRHRAAAIGAPTIRFRTLRLKNSANVRSALLRVL